MYATVTQKLKLEDESELKLCFHTQVEEGKGLLKHAEAFVKKPNEPMYQAVSMSSSGQERAEIFKYLSIGKLLSLGNAAVKKAEEENPRFEREIADMMKNRESAYEAQAKRLSESDFKI